MNMVIWYTLLLLSACNVKGLKNANKKETNCSQYHSQLQEASGKKECSLSPSNVSKIKQVCDEDYNVTCTGSPTVKTFYLNGYKKVDSYHYVIHVNLTSNLQGRKSCWGVILYYGTTDGFVDKCEYQNIKQNYVEFVFPFYPTEDYVFHATLLPTGDTISKSMTSPSICQLTVSKYIQKDVIAKKFVSQNHCFDKERPLSIMELSKKQCEKHNFKASTVINMLKKLKVTNNCELILGGKSNQSESNRSESNRSESNRSEPNRSEPNRSESNRSEPNRSESNQSESNNKEVQKVSLLFIVLVSVSISLILLVSVTCFVVRLRRKSHANTQDSVETQRIIQPIKTDSVSTSVMILNRPGCELLEVFLRDFAFVLSSYGVNVKMALLEQNEIDADGGIASYMQKHINKCDYILIMCTENTNEHSGIIKHKPYEFALKIIGGLAFHQNDSSRYIPMYLSSYKESVNIIPSFLNASTSFGYQLPQNIKKLLLRITSEEQLQATSERMVKDEFFINKMNEHSKKIIAKEHPHCIKDYCTKGTNHGSIENLSSVWPTTVQSSHWSSLRSVAINALDNGIIESTPYETNLMFKYNLMTAD
ncbi:uncharacterized protein LOC130662360 isoform X2 [Hydractinia symbiolongicarpus]|uniref:uncharacterized protein LOC130662360 isoform X2 n=1 Tax=Hydractinia symbiolongicarpus TaxID=13093 RepID=UPI00254AB102|nr:uncharacterized protein LOC130662360 isoform X2 [Hydractinia symbiolongicarpus]